MVFSQEQIKDKPKLRKRYVYLVLGKWNKLKVVLHEKRWFPEYIIDWLTLISKSKLMLKEVQTWGLWNMNRSQKDVEKKPVTLNGLSLVHLLR